jgi:hypothetical protein
VTSARRNRRLPPAVGGPHTVVVHRREHQLGPRRHEGTAGARVVILHQHTVTGIQEHAADQIQGLLRAVHDHDVVGICVESAQTTQPRGDGLSQLAPSGGWAVFEVCDLGIPGPCTQQPTPEGIGQVAKGGAPGTKVEANGRWRQFPREGGQSEAVCARPGGLHISIADSRKRRCGAEASRACGARPSRRPGDVPVRRENRCDHCAGRT